MVSAQGEQVVSPLEGGLGGVLDLGDRLVDRERGAGDVTRVGDLPAVERKGVRPGVVGADQLRPGADRRRAEARARPVDYPAVEGDADDRDRGAADGVQRRQPGEGGGAREAGDLQRIDGTDWRFQVLPHASHLTALIWACAHW